MTPNRKARRWRLAGLILLLLLATAVGLRILLERFLLHKIQTAVQQNFHTNLSAELSYRPPFTFVIRDCHFAIPHHAAPADLIDVAEVRVTLSRLPLGGGPTLVKDLELIDPVVDLQSLFPSAPEQPENGKRNPSQVLQIGHLIIKNGRIVLEDPSAQRNAWGQIRLNLDAAGTSPADYRFNFAAGGPIARLGADGSVNVDRRVASLDHFALKADFDSAPRALAQDPLAVLAAQYRLHGTASVEGSAHIDTRHPANNFGWAAFTVANGAAYLPDADLPINSIQLSALASFDKTDVRVTVSNFLEHSEGTSISLDRGAFRAAGDALNVIGLDGKYGNDQFTLSAQVPLISASHGILRMNDIDCRADFHPPSPIYFDPMDTIFAQFRPAGLWRIQGWMTGELSSGKVINYDLHVSSAGGAAATITATDVDLTRIKSDWELFPDHAEISRFQCTAMGGSLDTGGTVDCIRPYAYAGRVTSEGTDLWSVARLLKAPAADKSHYQGVLDLRATFSGSGSYEGKDAAALFLADGKFEIHHGALWDIPVLQRIADSATIARKALTMSEAAAYFHIADQTVYLQDAAINAPVLGLEGSGTVDFDGNLDLDVQAAPLADWKAKIQKTDVPVLSNLVGDVAGAFQKFLNTATGILFYEFHVTGDASDPKVTTIPAPAITLGTAQLFRYMIKTGDGGLLSAMQDPSSRPTTHAQSQPATEPLGSK